jgi:superfamily II DNA/RNA helicase
MPPKIRELARKILHEPEEINISLSKPPEKITQEAFVVYDSQKSVLIKYLLKLKDYNTVLIFCSKKHTVKDLTQQLKRAGFSIDEIHSDLEQGMREQVLAAFINKRLRILVATDILSRGIHIDNIDLVINYDVPNDGEDYVHRIGRTARSETYGTAFTLVNEREQKKFASIEALIGKSITKAPVPEQFGETPIYNPTRHSPTKHRHKRNFNGKNKSA